MEAAVGQRAPEVLVEEEKQESDRLRTEPTRFGLDGIARALMTMEGSASRMSSPMSFGKAFATGGIR